MNEQNLPPLCPDGHVVCLTATYLLPANGSGVVMRNLLGMFDPSSYTVGVLGSNSVNQSEVDSSLTRVLQTQRTGRGRINTVLFDIEMPASRQRLVSLVKEKNAKCLVGVYPNYHFLKLTRDVARTCKLPWLAYFHDTLAEHLQDTILARRAVRLQNQVFEEASGVMVMSEGMRELYASKYNKVTKALEHSYPEALPSQLISTPPEDLVGEALWGGSIYHINDKALGRVANALRDANLDLLITTRSSRDQLAAMGLQGAHIKPHLFEGRPEYIRELSRRKMLILALNWPDETSMDRDELATIFPTKTIEYLLSGRPILLHCPEDYFLAKFIRDHKCGLVVTERDADALSRAVKRLKTDNDLVQSLTAGALRAASLFSRERISGLFADHVKAVAACKWGEKS